MIPTADELYAIATGPTDIDWRAAFAARHEHAEATKSFLIDELATEKAKNATLRARIAELESSVDPMAVVIAAATELAKLTGESCHVECGAWCHPDLPTRVRAEWTAYRTRQSEGSYSGQTCEEAMARVRADWAKHHGTPDDTIPINKVLADPEPLPY